MLHIFLPYLLGSPQQDTRGCVITLFHRRAAHPIPKLRPCPGSSSIETWRQGSNPRPWLLNNWLNHMALVNLMQRCPCFVTSGDSYRYLWRKSNCHFVGPHCSSTRALSLTESSKQTKCSVDTENIAGKNMAGKKCMKEDHKDGHVRQRRKMVFFLYHPL